MYIIGLTGAIGAGKSTAVKLLRQLDVPVHDADATVHDALAIPKVRQALKQRFPALCVEPTVDRQQLGDIVFQDKEALKWLEDLLHPLVHASQAAFLEHHAKLGHPWVVLDVPLLFETGQDKACDHVVVVHSKTSLRHQRVLQRPGMSKERLGQIEKHQIPVAQKLEKADTVLHNDLDEGQLYHALRHLFEARLKTIQRPPVWGPGWQTLFRKKGD